MKGVKLFLFRRWLGLASAVGVLGIAGMTGLVTPVSAAAAPSATVGMVGISAAALPNVSIQGAPAKWTPTKLTVGPKNFTTCTKSKVVWTITNKTKKAQTISAKSGSGPKTTSGQDQGRPEGRRVLQGPEGGQVHLLHQGLEVAAGRDSELARPGHGAPAPSPHRHVCSALAGERAHAASCSGVRAHRQPGRATIGR